MSVKQDRTQARTPADLERKYNFGRTFAEVMGIATDAQTSAEKANAAVGELDTKLDHEEIFNRLTKNGTVQGIYRGDNGDIYINASYIKSGTLAADLVDTENLKVDAANITGTLTIGQLPNDVTVQTDVTTIIGNTVTTGYVNALGISVDAANINGTLSASQINLSGAITWDDFSADLQSSLESTDLPDYIQSTYIDQTEIRSPTISGGKIIGANIYAQGQGSFAEMNADGLYVYIDGVDEPKISLEQQDDGDLLAFILGAGSGTSSIANRFIITKGPESASLYYCDSSENVAGFVFGKYGQIHVAGTLIY